MDGSANLGVLDFSNKEEDLFTVLLYHSLALERDGHIKACELDSGQQSRQLKAS
jgi:hypothetical protein